MESRDSFRGYLGGGTYFEEVIMERVVTIPIYETREIEPYPSCEGRWVKECKEPKLKKMVRECPRFARILEEVELKLIEK